MLHKYIIYIWIVTIAVYNALNITRVVNLSEKYLCGDHKTVNMIKL
jgi:hypothetical protein